MGNSKLPHRDFRWLSQDEIESLDVENFNADEDVGLILEVDLSYPDHLHDKHKYYPMAPDNISITEDMLSPYAKTFLSNNTDVQKFHPQTRLAPNLYDKPYYVVHIRNLQFYLKHGLELKKVRRVISFYQSMWLKTFIDFNIQKRRLSQTSFDSLLYKLICNSVFGKD